MAGLVLDSSVTLAWFLPDERRAEIDALLDRVSVEGAVVPGLWPIEVGNAFLAAERQKRMSAMQRGKALRALAMLPIQFDAETVVHAWATALSLAEAHRLTLYDAVYLELAVRRSLPLASLDRDLRAAGSALNVALLGI